MSNNPCKKVVLINFIFFIVLVCVLIVTSGFLFVSCIKKDKEPLVNHKQNKTDKLDYKQAKNTRKRDKSVVTICQSETPPGSLDPIFFVTKREEITLNIFDRLVKWNNKGEIVNELAENLIMLDDTTLQINLKQGINFHNGETFDAESVKFTIDRILDKEYKTATHNLFKTIKEVIIIDPYTVLIKTHKPDYLLKRRLAFIQIIPAKYFEEVGVREFGKKPVGTSAYKFDKSLDDGSIVLVKNEKYWSNPKPEIPKAIFKFIKSDNMSKKEHLNALFSGEVDLLTDIPGIHTFKIQKNPDVKLVKDMTQSAVFKISFKSDRLPFSDIKVRQAINYAINRDLLIKILAKGNGRKIATPITSLEFGQNKSLKPYPYNPGLAKKLLKDAGYKNLFIKMVVTEEAEIVANAIAKDLKKLDIITDITVVSKEHLAYLLAHSKNKDDVKWDYDMDLYFALDHLLHAGYVYEEALSSDGVWSLTSDKKVDTLIQQLQVTLNTEEQLDLCHKLDKLAYDNYWYTPVYQIIVTYGAANDLDVKNNDASYLDLKQLYYINE